MTPARPSRSDLPGSRRTHTHSRKRNDRKAESTHEDGRNHIFRRSTSLEESPSCRPGNRHPYTASTPFPPRQTKVPCHIQSTFPASRYPANNKGIPRYPQPTSTETNPTNFESSTSLALSPAYPPLTNEPVRQWPPVHFIHVDRGVAPTMCLRRGFHLFGFRLDFLNTSRSQDEIRGLLGLRPRDNKRLGIGTQKFQPAFDIACRVPNRRVLDPGC